jgi:hypothetical protein
VVQSCSLHGTQLPQVFLDCGEGGVVNDNLATVANIRHHWQEAIRRTSSSRRRLQIIGSHCRQG